MELCPCGTKKEYKDCCKPYLSGKESAPTAELLMRSRYTAYAKHDVEYIKETHDPEKRDDISMEETRKWAEGSKWLGLTIINTSKGSAADDAGTVEFIAKYQQSGQIHDHHETSEFFKKNGKWYFKGGKMYNTTVVNAGPKISRNEPCPCGSGKKYKKCCG